MKKGFLTCIIVLIAIHLKAQTTIYVSNNGTVKTLKEAYDLIASPGNVTYHIILKDDGGDILIAPNAPGFVWTKSGTQQHPIKIYSENCSSVLTRNSESGTPMITLRNANYIHFYNVHFFKGVMGSFLFDNADYCSIEYCQFSGNGSAASISGGVIWIGENCQGNASSYGNTISNNKFFNLQTTSQTNQHHAIYISNKAYNTTIYNNSIIEPPSFSVHGWHGDYRNNYVVNNICIQKNNPQVNSSMIIGFNTDYDNCVNGFYPPSGVNNNTFNDNYVYDNQNLNCVAIDAPISGYNNTQSGNIRYHSFYPSDPYWLGYSPSQISAKVVSGDFNGDGRKDDIAALYDNGNGTTNMHVWKTDNQSNRAFIYDNGSQGWWHGSSYTAAQTTGRVVSGYFNTSGLFNSNDNKSDVAAFYDYGNGATQIHVWKSNGSSFDTPQTWWGVTTGYDAKKITNRVVAGNFDGDNKSLTDIAAFYDHGNGNTNLHVWKSTGSNFAYQWSAGWWGVSNGGYDVTKITGRVVPGDFNGDGKTDIAAFYDYGSGNTNLHVWLSTGTGFTYSNGSAGWWGVSNGGYDATKITGRVVSGDYNGDGKTDIAAFYDNGNGNTNLHVWISTGSSFTYQWSTGWWGVSNGGYDVNKITGRVVSGDFNRNGGIDDIACFYDHSANCGSVRTNVWTRSGSSFNYANYSLGYPWITSFQYANSIQLHDALEIENSIENNNTQLVIYPNPASDQLTIETKQISEEMVLSICNVNGQEQIREQINDRKIQVDISNLTSGIYVVKLITDKTIEVKKIIKE